MSHIDPDMDIDGSLKTSKSEEHLEQEMEQMNFYLQKIANLDSEYDGEYSLSLIKKHYHKLVKDKMKDEIENK